MKHAEELKPNQNPTEISDRLEAADQMTQQALKSMYAQKINKVVNRIKEIFKEEDLVIGDWPSISNVIEHDAANFINKIKYNFLYGQNTQETNKSNPDSGTTNKPGAEGNTP